MRERDRAAGDFDYETGGATYADHRRADPQSEPTYQGSLRLVVGHPV